jgi:hypothetical protein
MIDEKQIPDEVVEAAVTAWLEKASDYTRLNESIRAAIAAALAAWPGVCIRTRMQPDPENGGQWILPEKMLSLPLPKEGADD